MRGYAVAMRRHASFALAVVITTALAACSSSSGVAPTEAPTTPTASPPGSSPTASGSGAASVVPVIISSQFAVGDNRFVFSFLDPTGTTPIASPDRSASVAFIAPGQTQPGTPATSEFVWAIQGSRGEYIAHTTFSTAGDWQAVFTTKAPSTPQEAVAVAFQVQAKSSAVTVGQQAPASKTPTLADVGGNVFQLSTDPHPNTAFYQVSVAAALAAHTPFILVFATPAFCQSAQCGPTLDGVKAIAATAPKNVAFIHVEPYILKWDGSKLQPVLDANNQLQPVQAVTEWGLQTEPWVFAVDKTGIVRGAFEAVVAPDELQAAIAAIAGP